MRRSFVAITIVSVVTALLPSASHADQFAPPEGPIAGAQWLDPTWEEGDPPLVPSTMLLSPNDLPALRADIARYEQGRRVPRVPEVPPAGLDRVPLGPSDTPTPGDTPSPSPSESPSPTPTPTPNPTPQPKFAVRLFTVRILPPGRRPYDNEKVPSLRYHPDYHDAKGVPMAKIAGRLVYKPAGLAQLALMYLNGHRLTNNPAYIEKVDAIVAVFRRIGRVSGGGLYLPYDFDFAMHRNPRDVIRGPWYSAMAQGLALSVLTRLWKATNDDSYRVTGTQLMASLRHIGRGSRPWVTYIDRARNLWLEEYPQPHPEHTLNGFNFAVFGLYDWYLATKDPVALQYLRGSLTTLKRNVAKFRNVGRPSSYCLGHRKQPLKYHRIHIWQLRFMTAITNDPYFARIATLFERDAT